MKKKAKSQSNDNYFEKFKQSILSLDPVYFCENFLTLDGAPFRLNGNGYKPFVDIYRYIGIKALEPTAKPVVIVKGRQVGATTMAAALELFFGTSGAFGKDKPPMRVMHCFPLLEIAYKYTKTKLNSMIKSAIVDENISTRVGKSLSFVEARLDRSASSNDSLQYKQFEHGNHLFIESTGITGDRLRSITVDCIFFDEFQDTPITAVNNTTKSLTKAKHGKVGDGVQVYFGTPKRKGSEFYKTWKASNQQYFHLGCEKCGEYFPLYVPESNDWENIWIEDNLPHDHKSHGFIVKCTKCGHEQDKRMAAERGKWIALNDDPNCKFVGYHINQLYIPEFTRDKIIGEKPENHPNATERSYQNEVLGEFFSGDSGLITLEELIEACGDNDRYMSRSVSKTESKKMFLGLDWGDKVDIGQFSVGEKEDAKKQGKSYSCAVVLALEGAGLLSVEYAMLLQKKDLAYKVAVVDQLFKNFSIDVMVADIGHAGDLCDILAKSYEGRFFASRSLGSHVKNHVKFADDIFPKEIQFEKDFYIEEVHNLMKNGKIRFPLRDYEKIGWLLQHIVSMDIRANLSPSGDVILKYVKGLTPNDGFMALINAYLAYKYLITGGFKIVDPKRFRMDTKSMNNTSPVLLAHLPGYGPSRGQAVFRGR